MTHASRDSQNPEYGLPASIWPSALVQPTRPPRLVYLDLKDWISLARGIQGKGSAAYVDLYSALRTGIASNSIQVVLTGSLFREISKIPSPVQRSTLTSVIEELSGYSYLAGAADVFRLEVESALDAHFGSVFGAFAPVLLVASSALAAFGLTGGLKIEQHGMDVTERSLASDVELARRWPEIVKEAERALLAGPADEDIPALRARGYQPEIPIGRVAENAEFESQWATTIDSYRETHSIRDLVLARHMRLELLDFLTLGLLARGAILADLRLDKRSARAFVLSMPASCVAVTLLAQLHRQRRHHWTPNDLYDIDALSVAIPYCDIVFCDAAARQASVTAGLDSHFNTYLPRTPAELATYLHAEVP